jgi:hypothetical protein
VPVELTPEPVGVALRALWVPRRTSTQLAPQPREPSALP